jgi:linoleoyl-CoA desaturase
MTSSSEPHVDNAPSSASPERTAKLKFAGSNRFQVELRRRIDEYFQRTGRNERDCPQMYVKTAILFTLFVSSYVLLVFFANAWWQAVPLAAFVGLTMAGIGLNVQHDGGHRAYSNHPWINRVMAMTLDMLGGSSYIWHYKHGVAHHTYVNITGHDSDVDVGLLGRFTPHQKHFFFHRFQHFYMWPLYGFLAIHWHHFADYRDIILAKIGNHPIPRPRGWDLVIFVGGKLAFLTLAFGLPLFFHGFWVVLLFYVVAACVVGMSLSVVFQLAHCVEEAEFPMPSAATGNIENAWAIHQVESTVNFARRDHVITWLMGGLNFQIEHHLVPKICHIHYPALSRIVEETCREFGVRYAEHKSFWSGLASHYRWLRAMGRAPVAA